MYVRGSKCMLGGVNVCQGGKCMPGGVNVCQGE